jgi:hypothetical protein
VNIFKGLALAAVAGVCFTATATKASAQEVRLEVAPECPYGYYDTAPCGCAPYGYYGSNGFPAEPSSALARGFTGRKIFRAT